MNCRRLTVWAAAAAAVVCLASRPTPARADGIVPNTTGTATYRLTSDADIPAADGKTYSNGFQAVFDYVPGNGIVPPPDPANPGKTLTPLTMLTSSSGLNADPKNLPLGIKTVTNSDGSTTQLFGLSFFNQGLKSAANGGQLDFTLSVLKGQPDPTFTLDAARTGIAGLHIVELSPPTPPVTTPPPPVTTPPTPTPPNASTPEPVSLLLWSGVIGLGVLRARAVRRRAG